MKIGHIVTASILKRHDQWNGTELQVKPALNAPGSADPATKDEKLQ
jgi:hypothetical protein